MGILQSTMLVCWSVCQSIFLIAFWSVCLIAVISNKYRARIVQLLSRNFFTVKITQTNLCNYCADIWGQISRKPCYVIITQLLHHKNCANKDTQLLRSHLGADITQLWHVIITQLFHRKYCADKTAQLMRLSSHAKFTYVLLHSKLRRQIAHFLRNICGIVFIG